MSRDEQEAESRKYHAFQILHLSSGNYAVWQAYRLIYIGPYPLTKDLRFVQPLPVAPKRPAPATIDLRALGFIK